MVALLYIVAIMGKNKGGARRRRLTTHMGRFDKYNQKRVGYVFLCLHIYGNKLHS